MKCQGNSRPCPAVLAFLGLLPWCWHGAMWDIGGYGRAALLGMLTWGRCWPGGEEPAIFMFPSKCMDQSRHFNLFNNISRIKKLQANHRPKLVIYFCLSVDKSLCKPLLHLPAVPGCAGLGCASLHPSVSWCLCHTPPQEGCAGRVWQQLGELGLLVLRFSPRPKPVFLSLPFYSPSQPERGWGCG